MPNSSSIIYTPSNWYWSVQDASPATQVWSSAAVAYVSLNNLGYANWLMAGNTPTVIGRAADLNDVLVAAGQTPVFPTGILTALEFRDRFTLAEQMMMAQFALGNAQALDWYFHCAMIGNIDLSNAVVIGGIDTLAAAGVLSTQRAAAILTP